MLQNIFNFFFVYFVTFWIVIFLVLPFGVKTDDSPQSGNDRGAPKNAMMLKKFIITAVITLVLTSFMFYLNESGLVTYKTMIGEE